MTKHDKLRSACVGGSKKFPGGPNENAPRLLRHSGANRFMSPRRRYALKPRCDRLHGYAASGPWETWPYRPIPNGEAPPALDAWPVIPAALVEPVSVGEIPQLSAAPEPAPAPMEPVASNDAVECPKPQLEVCCTLQQPPQRRRTRSVQAESVGAEMHADEAGEAAAHLLRMRLEKAARPYSVIESEARAAGIPVDVLAVTANRLGIVTVEGRWVLPTNGAQERSRKPPGSARLNAMR